MSIFWPIKSALKSQEINQQQLKKNWLKLSFSHGKPTAGSSRELLAQRCPNCKGIVGGLHARWNALIIERWPLDELSRCPKGRVGEKKAGQGLKEGVHCYMTAFGGKGWDLFRDVMHMHVSKAKWDGKEHSVLEEKKTLKLLGQHNSRPKSI